MLNGVGWNESVAVSLAAAVVLVAAVLVYRDAREHGNYHAFSATAAVAVAGLVGYAVGDLVGLFVGTGYVLLLYLLSYPTTPTPDPNGPRGDAGENIASEEEDDTLSVIRVEVASGETLRELAQRYDDVPEDGTEAELRSALRVKALSDVAEWVDGETDVRDGAADTRPERGLTDPEAPAARASEYGIEEWSSEVAADPPEPDPSARTAPSASATRPEEPTGQDTNLTEQNAETAGGDVTERDETERSAAPASAGSSDDELPDSDGELPDRDDELAAETQQWVATNVDQELGVIVGEALDTPDVHDEPEEPSSAYSVRDWSAEEPPAETDADSGARERRTESAGTTESDGETTAEAAAEGEATDDGGVWDTAGETTEAPETEPSSVMVFDNAVAREDGTTESDAESPQSDSGAESTDESGDGSTGADSTSESSGDGDPFDGRGELYDADENAPAYSRS